MIDLAPIIKRLKSSGLGRVDGVTALARINEKPPTFFPCFYVVCESERGEAPARVVRENPGLIDQSMACTVSVIGMFRQSAADADAAEAEIRDYAEAAEKALLGWVHPDDSNNRAAEFISSRLLGVTGGVVSWGISFRMWRRVRGVAQP